MLKRTLTLIFVLLSVNSFSQIAGLNYARNIGGSSTDMFLSNVLLRNGNLVSAGYTESFDGDAQGNHGTVDCFVVCTSPDGTILWRKVIGGLAWDAFNADVDTTTDGNIVVGFTTGSTDGDITGNHGNWDLAFFKYTPEGNLLWSKTYGGAGDEDFGSLSATPDGGIIASACTASSNSGDVTGLTHGSYDLWIIKLDKTGAIEWQKLYGGTSTEMAVSQAGGKVVSASDGGYFFATPTTSTDGDLNGLLPPGAVLGGGDMWLCHIDATGNILWSKLIGGSGPEDAANLYTHGSSLYCGFGTQSADRDLQGNQGLYDLALFKFNTEGTLQWKQQYASSAWDNLGDITGLKGDLLTLTGGTYSFSFAGYQMPPADERLFVMRIDTLNGSIKWLKALGGNGRSQGAAASINNNGALFISGLSTNTTGDIYANKGGYDAVLLSFAAGNRFKGTIFVDDNNNHSPDAGEVRPDHLMLKASKEGVLSRFTTTRNGDYSIEVDTGLYTVEPLLRKSPYYTAEPAQFSHPFSNDNETYNQDIALYAIPNVKDLTVSLTPLTIIRPGRIAQYLLTGYNVGTTTISSGVLGIKKEHDLSFANFSATPDFQSGDSASWNFNNLEPFDSVSYLVSVSVPTFAQGGTTMNYVLYITPLAGDSTPENNTIYFRHIVVNSFDPNCKTNNMGDSMPVASVLNGDYIYYTIQFQNTGTASAIDISVKDTLPANLLDSTMEIVCASHPFGFSLKERVATWNFFNINLPDSNTNERLSHGYIQYRIKAIPTLAAGDFIDNTAAIYFDFNQPVITENNRIGIFIPTIVVPAAPVINPAGSVTLCTSLLLTTQPGTGYQWYKNDVAIAGAISNTYTAQDTGRYTVKLTVNNVTSESSAATTISAGLLDSAIITLSNNLLTVNNEDAANTYTWQLLTAGLWFDISPLETGASYQPVLTGDYRVKIDKGLCTGFSNLQHWETPVIVPTAGLKIYPNPFANFIKIDNLTGSQWKYLEIINFIGEKMLTPVYVSNLSTITVNTQKLNAGIYILLLRDDKGNTKKIKLIKL